jgi:leucyl-tRNA synthetase
MHQPTTIEPFWQKAWQSAGVYKTGDAPHKPKYYVLDMFPYPSASGLHVGHGAGYTATDVLARYYRAKGFNVLHPMGWDAFGLPSEQHAIETGEHPAHLTYRNAENYKKELMQFGYSYDWEREIYTCKPDYYKWTQQIFSLLYKKGLAYQAEVSVNWCPALKTVLANEEVENGLSERGGHPVFRVPMRQWMLKITDYAERLLNDLDKLNWPESTKEIQRNWIGKSVGAKVKFKCQSLEKHIEVFTTRADTLYGVTYMVLAPEHPLVLELTTSEYLKEVEKYQKESSKKSDLDRTELNKQKTGVFTGGFALHPLTGDKIPVYISDYVLISYGTGAIMAVPAHDERDYEFAKKFQLKVIPVVHPTETEMNKTQKSEVLLNAAYTGDGTLVNSPLWNGITVAQAKEKAIAILEEKKLAEKCITYKLRDWLFSRQRYWGEPIPVVKNSEGKVIKCLEGQELPLTLPEVSSYHPTDDGKSPLANVKSWVQRTDEAGNVSFTETDTMPGTAGSSWYFLRYLDPQNTKVPFDFEKAKYWMPVDTYVGGQEHAVGHLLYSRFWTKVLFDAGMCPVDEPFERLIHQGMICRNGSKMSKSKKNGVSPTDVFNTHGADALRVYLTFMGPVTQTKEWDDSNLAGVARFLSRIEKQCLSDEGQSFLTEEAPLEKDLRALHKTIKKLSEDIPQLNLNTCISQMMIFLNHMTETKCKSVEIWKDFFILLSPFAPHLSEELWYKCVVKEMQNPNSLGYPFVCKQKWPEYKLELAADNEIKIGVQVNGKNRGEILIPRDCEEVVAVQMAKQEENIASALSGKNIKKTIFVKNRILSFVVD